MSLHDLPVQTLQGEETTLGAVTGGGAALLVNVASKCGLTPQYVPCNQFGGQEPGTADEIAEFCSATYGVTFPMLAKVDVNGPGRAPLFDALTAVPDAEGEAGDVKWNFEKWLVSKDGEVVARFRPLTAPSDPELRAAVEQVL
ncbi:MAG: glutathione peroxidase [Actinobacteria bacterium]|nr:glutathione peroxidase [Actinomycetota bacterium]